MFSQGCFNLPIEMTQLKAYTTCFLIEPPQR